jgi:hypothetical protein
MYVHTKETTDQVERNKNRRDDRNLLKRSVAVVPLNYLIDRDLSEVIGVRTAEHLFEMRQVGHHSDDVILDIAEVHAHVASGSDAVGLVAALGEALDDIGFAAQKTEKLHDALAAVAD